MGYTPPQLYITKVGTTTSAFGLGSTTGDILYLYPNLIENKPNIKLIGASDASIDVPTGHVINFLINGTGYGSIGADATDLYFSTASNRNINLGPNGTGKVKFGTHTGSGDVACNGSIAILDGAGNARKLMTTA